MMKMLSKRQLRVGAGDSDDPAGGAGVLPRGISRAGEVSP
jgi:hypothetical protein